MSSANALQQLDSTTLADQAYDAIREAIISGELASQQKITERGLADAVGGQPHAGARGAAPARAGRARAAHGRANRAGRRLRRLDHAGDPARRRCAPGRSSPAWPPPTPPRRSSPGWSASSTTATASSPACWTSTPTGASPATELLPLLAITREFHAELNAACNNPVILRLLRTVEAFKLATISSDLTVEIETVGGTPRRRSGTTSTGRCSRRCAPGTRRPPSD